jgi:UPF0755 protein
MLAVFSVAAVLLIAGLASVIWILSELDTPYYGAQPGEVFLEIPRHAGTNQVASILASSGILRQRLPFILYLRYTNLGRHIQAGEYRFAEPATPKQVVQRLIHGDVSFRSVTVPEGLTAHETVELLVKSGLGKPEELEQLLLKTDLIRDLNPKARNLEGYLFPETYRFSRKVDPETVIRKMVHQFRIRMDKIIAQYPIRDDWTVERIVILASMIEKEVKQADEGPIVASVLVNRLERKMPLACDATIIYAMKLAGTYEGRLGRADMVMQSPYNSYLNGNLPPGPICSPGELSLRAALNPARTDYLYYVSRNDGTHQFSRDLASHQHAVERFQKSPYARRNPGKR